jgi:ubiquitin-protein ligase
MWFVGDPARLERERAAIAVLMSDSDWLQDVDWRLTADGRVKLDFKIVVGDRVFALRMTYPKLFPFTPPEVAPVGEDLRLSSHQYGDATGNLCLQHRSDNWVPTVTGADMIRSAHELLSTERPAEGPAREVPSDHCLTEGQELRNKTFRLLMPAEMRELAARLAEGVGAPAEVRLRQLAQCMTVAIDKVHLPDGEWRPTNFPKAGVLYKGIIVRVTPSEYEAIVDDPTVSMARRDAIADDLALTDYAQKEFLVAFDGESATLAWQLYPDKPDVVFSAALHIDSDAARLPTGYDALSSKKVAIVGCGSAGSKIAVSLARSGVRAFLLVDDDLFLRDNLVRNDLDWRSVGEHKADGVARRIRGIDPGAAITIRRLKLSGQESAASAASALEQIAGCDLIVDATADPHAFNLLASVCETSKKPMVWLEVFAGGIGGFVARHLPAIDPKPQIMRNAYGNWCRSQAVPWTDGAAGAYAAQPVDGPVLVADDADVAVIAAHTARMAVNALIDGRGFPHSMYVLSLRAGWMFDQPFEAYPIDVQAPAAEPATEVDPDDKKQGLQFLVEELLSKVDDEASAA